MNLATLALEVARLGLSQHFDVIVDDIIDRRRTHPLDGDKAHLAAVAGEYNVPKRVITGEFK